MSDDIDRLVKQAREIRPHGATGESAFRFIQEAPSLLEALANEVERLQKKVRRLETGIGFAHWQTLENDS